MYAAACGPPPPPPPPPLKRGLRFLGMWGILMTHVSDPRYPTFPDGTRAHCLRVQTCVRLVLPKILDRLFCLSFTAVCKLWQPAPEYVISTNAVLPNAGGQWGRKEDVRRLAWGGKSNRDEDANPPTGRSRDMRRFKDYSRYGLRIGWLA